MEHHPIITLITDFGHKDPFVGIMKGVMLNINPAIKIIDISHGIKPQNILEASFLIETSFSFFPNNTIHLVIVDPGVGSERRPIIVSTGYHYFIGPDNGVFSRIYKLFENFNVIHVTSEHYFLPQQSTTFHGRDIFAPVAAWLSRGIDTLKFGEPVNDYITIAIPTSSMPAHNIIQGEVIYIDNFGNATTNIDSGKIDNLRINQSSNIKIMIKGKDVPLKKYYAEATDNELHSLINSFGYLELFVYKGNAAQRFNIQINEKVSVIANDNI